METAAARLATWARSIRPADVPPDVMRRTALLHLSMAAVVRSADLDAPADLLTRGDRSEAALSAAARRSAAREFGDFGFFGHPTAGAVLGAWAAIQGHRIDELLAATAVAAEVAARIGTATMLEPEAGEGRVFLSAAAAAIATAWLRDLSPEETTNALTIALARPRRLDAREVRSIGARTELVAEAVLTGANGASLAARGDGGDPNLLDYPDGLPGVPTWHPLRVAWEDLGRVWLSRALVFRLQPVAPWALTAVQGFHEILRRHQKAASKRLRVDQVERIEVRLDHLAWMRAQPAPAADRIPDDGLLPFSIPHAIGVLAAAHEDGPALYDEALLRDRAADILSVAAKVEVRPDLGLTVQRMRGVSRALAPLMAEVPRRKRGQMARSVLREALANVPMPDRSDWASFLRSDPLALVEGALEAPPSGMSVGDPNRPGGLHIPAPTFLRLYTSRGGWWPERRSVVEGGPEYTVDDLTRDVVQKYARACSWRAGSRDEAAESAAAARAQRWLRAAGAPSGPEGLTAEEAVALLGAS